MPYPQDLKGKLFKFNIEEPGIAPANQAGLMDGQTSAMTCNVRNAPMAPGSRPRANAIVGMAPPVIGGPPPIPPRPVLGTWLKYVRGGVTRCPVGQAAITGKMSGCFLFAYRQDGALQLAHCGTVDMPNSRDSVRAKETWIDFANSGQTVDIKGGQPSAFFSFEDALPLRALSSKEPFVLGYLDPAGTMYALLGYYVKPTDAPNPGEMDWIKVHDVKQMTLQPWSAIAPLRTFRDLEVQADTEGKSFTGVIPGWKLGEPVMPKVR